MREIGLLLIFVLSSFSLGAQEKYLRDLSDMEALSQRVVQLFADHEITFAFEELAPYWPLPENEFDDLKTKTLKYMNLIHDSYGASIGTIKVREEKIGDVAVRTAYLVRYDYTAIRLIFTYYLSDQGWLLNAFKWDDSFEEEFR
jgi:hypothetical protein